VGLIYVDACLLIYAIEDHPRFGARVRARIGSVPAEALAVSPLVHLECRVGPMRAGNAVLLRYYEQALGRLVQLPLPQDVFLRAARLRAEFGLKTPDALHLSAALHHGCEALWTNDGRLMHAGRGLAVNVLD
jgi:predicted nucleic acid-binding protein